MNTIGINKNSARGFSLVEIIVVLGIIIGLSTIVYGYIQNAQNTSQRTQLYQDINFIRAAQSSYRSSAGEYTATIAQLGLADRFGTDAGNPYDTEYALGTGTYTGTDITSAQWALLVTLPDSSEATVVKAYFDNQDKVVAVQTAATALTNALLAEDLTEDGVSVAIYFD